MAYSAFIKESSRELTAKERIMFKDTTSAVKLDQATLPRTYKDVQKLMKAVEKALEGEPIKAVAINSYEVKETLYGMTEEEFIQHARILPPRGTKEEE